MKDKRSIRSIILVNMTLVTLSALVLWNILWVVHAYRDFQKDAVVLRKEYVAGQRDLIKQEVDTVVSFIEDMRTQTETRLKESIKSRVYEAIQIATSIYEKNKGQRPDSEIKEMIKDALRPIKYNQGRGYYFGFSFKKIGEVLEDRCDLDGPALLSLKDGWGRYVVREMMDLINREGEGYYYYSWTKPGFGRKYFSKISYLKNFEPYGWVVGAGEYIDDVETQIKNEVVERAVKFRFGQEGYFFGSTFDGGPLFSNGVITKGTGNILDLTDPNGVKIIQEQIRLSEQPQGGYVSYVWNKIGSDRPVPKVSYVRGIPGWRWVIGTGVYLDTIENKIEQRRQYLNKVFRNQVLESFLFLLAFMTLIFLLVNRDSKKISASLAAFSQYFKKAATQSEPIRPENVYLKEFDEIAEAAEGMLLERKAAEDALRKSEEQLSLAIEGSGVGLWDWRIKEEKIFFNQRWAEMLGFDRDEIYPLDVDEWLQMVHPQDLSAAKHLVDDHFDFKNKVFESEVQIRHKKGHWVWILSRGKVVERDRNGGPIRMTGTHLDITRRKQADEALAESEERFRSFTLNSPVGVMLHTGEEVTFVNPALVRMFGAESESWFKGRSIWELLAPECQEEARRRSAMALEQGKTISGKEFRLIRADGKEFYAESMGLPLTLAGRRRIYTLLIDLTERKKVEREKEYLESQLRQAQKMDALGTLAGGIAHDFNNILAAIIGYSELALEDAQGNAESMESIEEVIKAGKRAKELVNQILTFSRKMEPELRPVNLNRVVSQTEKMLERTIPKMIRIDQCLSRDLKPVSADSGQLAQILMNLIANATDAMPEGGRLTIETDNVALDQEYCDRHAGVLPGEYVRLTVSDTGMGMDRETMEHIFDPFFTQKEVGKGTGLGLATVYGVVKNHGGHVVCFSEPGQGTTFRIYLPIISMNGEIDWTEDGTVKDAPGGDETLLMVDDEKTIRDLGRRILKEKGYQTLFAETGEEALDIFREKGDEIDLVILDISMPGMGGQRCQEELLRLNPGARILIVSGYSLDGELEDILSTGASGYLAKPFSKSDLLRMIREVLDQDQSGLPARED